MATVEQTDGDYKYYIMFWYSEPDVIVEYVPCWNLLRVWTNGHAVKTANLSLQNQIDLMPYLAESVSSYHIDLSPEDFFNKDCKVNFELLHWGL